MEILNLATWGFRNLEPGPVELDPGVNLLFGANGQGKTNLLEALSVLGTLRSFRTARLRVLAARGSHAFRVAGTVRGVSGITRLEVQWDDRSNPRRRTLIEGSDAPVDQYLRAVPVVVVSPADRELVAGRPAARRAYLDRLAFLLHPAHLGDLRLYMRLLEQRNAALGRGLGGREMAAWEDRLAEAAARVVTARRRALRAVRGRFGRLYTALGREAFPGVDLQYGAESFLSEDTEPEEVAEIYRKRYNDQRDRDREAGYTTAGPHRHDLVIRSAGGAARDYLSAGQIKAIVMALRLSFLEEVEQDRGERIPLGIDDIDVEIDEAVTRRVLSLAGSGRQLLVTSTRGHIPGLGAGECHRLVVDCGSVRRETGYEEHE